LKLENLLHLMLCLCFFMEYNYGFQIAISDPDQESVVFTTISSGLWWISVTGWVDQPLIDIFVEQTMMNGLCIVLPIKWCLSLWLDFHIVYQTQWKQIPMWNQENAVVFLLCHKQMQDWISKLKKSSLWCL